MTRTAVRPNTIFWVTALAVVALGIGGLVASCGGDSPGGTASLEPCSVFLAEEARSVLKGPVKQEVPSPIKYKGLSTGGTCVYRLQKEPMTMITIRTDATPTGAQKQRFAAGLRHAPAAEFSGLGDRAYTEIRPKGPQAVTFLRGDTLTSVTVEGLSIEVAKQVAALVAPRLPTSVIEPPPPATSAVAQGSGKLDPGLIGSWFLKQPNGRGLANLHVARDGTFYMEVLAGGKQQKGKIDGESGVLHLYPERGGQTQEIRYKIVDKNQMEWTDQKGIVTIARRQFR
jgi:hypothetical protein